MAGARGRALEALEDPELLLGRDAHALVADGEAGVVRVDGELDFDRPPAAELDRVTDQVGDHLTDAEPIPVPDHPG